MITGIQGRPFVPMERYLDLGCLPELHEEICLGLAQVAVDYTGGSHKTMGIVPPSLAGDPYIDYGQVIRKLDPSAARTFLSLSDEDTGVDPARIAEHTFGEERDHPLSRRQMLFLKYRHGVYFPWKVYYELIPNLTWEGKSDAAGKAFTREARAFFPKTIAFVKSLPFEAIGRANIMGLEANDHGTVHRDGVPEEKPRVDHFITFSPASNKRLYLWDEDARTKTFVTGHAYWFNDSDYHGVEPDPFFRYSIRVDGLFRPELRAALGRDLGQEIA